MDKKKKCKIAVFISGGGTNLQAIINSIEDGEINGEIIRVISSDPEAYGVKRANNHNIPVSIYDFTKESREEDYKKISQELNEKEINLIVLAGFMKVMPADFVKEFEKRIINLHPSLLPKHGGVGMYGDNVHRTVLESGDKISGATVHYVDEGCDTGEVISRYMTNVYNDDTIETLSNRIHVLEHRLLTKVVRELCE